LGELERVRKPENEKNHKKKLNALKGDIQTLTGRIAAIQRLSDSVGGMIGEEDARELILKKHHDLVTEQLQKYLGTESRTMVQVFENFWIKYCVSVQSIDTSQQEISAQLNKFLTNLSYTKNL